MTYALAYGVTTLVVGLKAAQQLNVQHNRKRIVPVFSVVMQFSECAVYGLGGAAFIASDYWQMLCMGLGAGTGTLVAMCVNDRLTRRLPASAPAKLRRVK